MTVDQLTLKENELYSIVMDLSHKGQSKETDEQLEVVYDLYKKVHKYYADMADKDDEALKRGLFIQWYAITEPGYLTGINSLDELAETKIIKVLNDKILSNTLDAELNWMLNYYVDWAYAFDRFKGYQGLDNAIKNCKEDGLPKAIDKISMHTRGQMGMYWSSLNCFD